MGKRQNYGFQRHQKEAEKQKKRDEKAEKKRARREAADEAVPTDGVPETDEESDRSAPGLGGTGLAPGLRARLQALSEEGWDLWDRFDNEVRRHEFHPFVAADYPVVLEALVTLRAPGLRFLEWGSATGVVTIMADLLGFDAYGIEIDEKLVEQARGLAERTGSRARFTTGSFLPTGYRWRDSGGGERLGTIADGPSAYLELGMPLEDFDLVFAYPWTGEEPMMLDLMRAYGRPGARLLLHTERGIVVYRDGRVAA